MGIRQRMTGVKSSLVVSGALVAGVGGLGLAMAFSRREHTPRRIRAAVSILAPPRELYQLWIQPGTHMRTRPGVVIERVDEARWHWRRNGHTGRLLEWDTEIIALQEPHLVAWDLRRARPGCARAVARFLPREEGRTSVVAVTVDLTDTPRGMRRWIEPLIQNGLSAGLRRFRQLVETGEIATARGQSSGERSGAVRTLDPYDRGQPEQKRGARHSRAGARAHQELRRAG